MTLATTSPDFNVAQTGTALATQVPLLPSGGGLNTGAQGFAFDDANKRMYTLQCFDRQNGHLWLSWYDLSSGKPVAQSQYMTLNNFGHGQQMGVQVVDGTTYLWTEVDSVLASNNLGYGSKIARFAWVPGRTLDGHTSVNMTKYTLQPGSTGNSVSIDLPNSRLLLGFVPATGGATQLAIYDINSVINSGDLATPLSKPITAAYHTGTMQGRVLCGDYNYSVAGAGKSPLCGDAPESWLGWQNIWTGVQGWSANRTALSIPGRESEGIAIQTVGSVRRLVWSFTTKKDCTGSGNWLQSWYYIPDSVASVPVYSTGSNAKGLGGPLGCGSYRVYVYDRGAADRIGEITPLSRVQWNRVRDDISSALVNTVGFGQDCCEMLEGLRTMRHELVIFRDGVRVWEGPLTRIAFTADGVELEARDVMQYIYRRIFRLGYNHSYQAGPKGPDGKPTWVLYPHGNPVVDTAYTILSTVLAPSHYEIDGDPHEPTEFSFGYDPNILKYIYKFPHNGTNDAHESRKVLPFSMTAWELIDDLAANSGIDYTVLGRSIIIWDTSYPIHRIGVMDDSDFMANPVVTEYGMSLATFAAVTDGNGFYGVSGAPDHYYGMIEVLSSSYGSTLAPDKSGIPSYRAVQDARTAYIERFHQYHSYPCLSAHEKSTLARYYRERNTKGVKPARQKVLDALIKPLADRVIGCQTLLTRMNHAKSNWKAKSKAYTKYEKQINDYITSLNSQAARNLVNRRAVLTDHTGKKYLGGAPVIVRVPDNTQLNPEVMLGINDLVPGIWIPLRSTATCRQITQWQKLDSVSVTLESGAAEAVAVTMSPAPQSGGDADLLPIPDTDSGTGN